MWTAREVANAGGHEAVEAIRRQFRYARGGPVLGNLNVHSKARDPAAFATDFTDEFARTLGRNAARAGEKLFGGSGKVLPPGSYRIGRGPAAHGYNARDLPVPTGTPVYAGVAGPVTRAAYLTTSYGIHTKVDGVLYAHLSKLFVRLGQQVLKGQRIGLSGSTGNSTGPHLHIEPDLPQLYDRGGLVKPGEGGVNLTRRPEAFLSPRETSDIKQLALALQSGGAQGGEFIGNLYLDSGELMGVIKGTISSHDRDLKRRARAGTGAAR
jgi:murein DD-endopeptidase MepM/ murein hydrolase activator NlpD